MENIGSVPSIIDERCLPSFCHKITIFFILLLLFTLIGISVVPLRQHRFQIGQNIDTKVNAKIQFVIPIKKLIEIENKTLKIENKKYTYKISGLQYVSEKEILVEISLKQKIDTEIVKLHFWGRKQSFLEKIIQYIGGYR